MATTSTSVPGPTGSSVRTLEITFAKADGTFATVEMQVVAIADANGTIVDFASQQLQIEMLTELRHIRDALEKMSSFHGPKTLNDSSTFSNKSPEKITRG